MHPAEARAELTRGLQLAHAGELGAVRAYLGHRAAVSEPAHRNAIAEILKDEIRHRQVVRAMLQELGSAPDPQAEARLDRVGKTIGFACRIGGWFFPMYGAARLESSNIEEYEIAARLAWLAGLDRFVDPLLHLAEVEWDHEHILRELAASHWLWRVTPHWTPPSPRPSIRARFAAFTRAPHRVTRPSSILLR